MKKPLIIFPLVLLFSACGLVNQFIPDQDINVLPLDGKQAQGDLDLKDITISSTNLKSKAIRVGYAGKITFTDPNVPDVTASLPAQPKDLVFQVGMTTVKFEDNMLECINDKAEVWVEKQNVSLKDNSSGKTFGVFVGGTEFEVFIVKRTQDAYTLTKQDGSQALLNQVVTLAWDSDPLFKEILTTGGPNTLSYTMSVYVFPALGRGAQNCPRTMKVTANLFVPRQVIRFK
jgi:hypothetical protein